MSGITRRLFLKALGVSMIGAALPRLPTMLTENDTNVIAPDPGIGLSAVSSCCSGPVAVLNGAGECYVSYDFWSADVPTWERA